jgi:hypothetical protein
MPAKHEKMTAWYDPARLASIGIHVAEATVFGHMFDRRELMAALDPFNAAYFDDNFNFAKPEFQDANGDFWLDFTADTGDGWHSTYAVARLLARKELQIGDYTLPRGRVLVFGGDEVYPTASTKDYNGKLKAPFDAANRYEKANLDGHYLFAVPGNHDWYDDLTSFTALFCNKAPDRLPGAVHSPGRQVCGRETAQTRSYFALKLPHDWWLCAFDAQLEGYIDAPQMRFFEYVAQHLMQPGSNVILSVAGPVWAYSRAGKAEGFSNFAFASLIATGASGYPGYTPSRQHNLRLVLTGDSHHYAHFTENAPPSDAVIHYLTCGLGGAFLHPTHWLENTTPEVEWPPPPPLRAYDPANPPPKKEPRTFRIAKDKQDKELLFPDRVTSSRMTWRNVGFLWFNKSFGVFMALVGVFAAWLLHFGAGVLHTDLQTLLGGGSLWTGLENLGRLFFDTPWPWLIIVGIFAALRYFVDYEDSARKICIGAAHTVAHVVVFLLVLLIAARILPNDISIVVVTGVTTGVTSPTIMGLYLLLMLNVFKVHWDEAYSSLRIADYKGFLRLRFTAAGNLEVYPVVLDKVPHSDTAELTPYLFEGPISIETLRQPAKAGDGQS